MSCPFSEEILLLDSEQPRERRSILEAHVKTCDLCGEQLSTLRGLRAAARMLPIPSERPGARAELMSRLNARANKTYPWMQLAFGAAAAIFAAVLWFDQPREAPPKTTAPVHVARAEHEAGEILNLGAAKVTVTERAKLRVESGVAKLDAGRLELVVVPAPSMSNFIVQTPELRVRVIEGTLAIAAIDAASEVRVVSGTAMVSRLDDPTEHTLRAGQSYRSDQAQEPAQVEKKPPPPQHHPKAAQPATTVEARVREAKATLDRDPPRAAELALDILSETPAPAPAIEANAIAVIADARRRSGEREDAARWYARLAAHPNGTAYVEEATYREAQLLRELGRFRAAIAVLGRAMPTKALLPERLSLEAELNEELGDHRAASSLFNRAAEAARRVGDLRSAEELDRRAK